MRGNGDGNQDTSDGVGLESGAVFFFLFFFSFFFFLVYLLTHTVPSLIITVFIIQSVYAIHGVACTLKFLPSGRSSNRAQ